MRTRLRVRMAGDGVILRDVISVIEQIDVILKGFIND